MRIIQAAPRRSGDFSAILERLDHPDLLTETEPMHVGPGGHVRPDANAQSKDWLLELIDSLSAAPAAAPPSDRAAARYAEEMAEPAPSQTAVRRALPDDQASVAAELALRDDMTDEELRHLRRAFALANHPDRLLPDERLPATRRMTIANMLIDQHLKQKTRSH